MSTSLTAYIVVSFFTVLSPGPAVLYTITNTLNFGVKRAFIGYLGVAVGILVVAAAATLVVLGLATLSPLVLTGMNIAGGCFFLHLAIKNWRSASSIQAGDLDDDRSHSNVFFHGLMISLMNPKALVFFLSVFPLFVAAADAKIQQCVVLSLLFFMNVMFVHSGYCLAFKTIGKKVPSQHVGRYTSRLSALIFLTFSLLIFNQTLS